MKVNTKQFTTIFLRFYGKLCIAWSIMQTLEITGYEFGQKNPAIPLTYKTKTLSKAVNCLFYMKIELKAIILRRLTTTLVTPECFDAYHKMKLII